jgi:glyoxylase-like metal-dependent hydrolase (beta-lactamase superfamily II)
MTALALMTRRMLLKDMGKAGLAVMVLGTAACSEEPTEDTTSPSDPTTTAAGPTTTAADAPNTLVPPAGEEPWDWQRVNLGFVSAYILYRQREAVIVDTGVEGSEGAIEAALGEIGAGWDRVSTVIVTHKHPDHQGSVEAVLERTPQATVVAGISDIPAIVTDREVLPMFDGQSISNLQIIETPGHTPGHISVLDPVAGILVAGDALNGSNGGVTGANAQFSEDMSAANASVAKLATFDYEVALFGHGEPVLSGASSAVAALAAGY